MEYRNGVIRTLSGGLFVLGIALVCVVGASLVSADAFAIRCIDYDSTYTGSRVRAQGTTRLRTMSASPVPTPI